MIKYIKNKALLGLASSFLLLACFSCDDDNEAIVYPEGGPQKVGDTYLQISTTNSVVPFQAGTPEYSLVFNVVNGLEEIDNLKVYAIYTDATSGKKSERTLLKTVPVNDELVDEKTIVLTYEDLKAGITVDGQPLPASDVDLAVGSGWKLSFEGVAPNGNIVPLGGNINVAVLSRFAGNYKVIQSSYFRIDANNGDWNGEIRFIGSIDEDTFSYNDYWGLFAWTGSSFYFDVDFDATAPYPITVPITPNGLFSGTRALNCKTDAAVFKNVPCEGSNVLIPNDATGKHMIKITYGYFTDGSGAREFYEVLEKIVD